MTKHDMLHGGSGHEHGSYKSYIIGFILSIALTIIPYEAVAGNLVSGGALIALVVAAAVLQLLVQLIFFLHLNAKSDGAWNLMAFIFTIIIVVAIVIGSLWILWNMNYNMMENM